LKSVRLIFWSALVYGILLVFARGILPSNTIPAVSLAGVPLIVIALIIVRDLSRRSTSPTVVPRSLGNRGMKEDPVRFLGGQIRVAANASDSYFDNVVRSRLRELLISKVALETGYDPITIRGIMSDPKRGGELLHDKELYMALYGQLPDTKYALMQMVENAIDMIGDWKS
jgi:hypothetical protein